MANTEEKRELYAVVAKGIILKDGKEQWAPLPIQHVHAFSAANAKVTFLDGIPVHKRNRVEIIGAARAIGFFCDDNGENLSAS